MSWERVEKTESGCWLWKKRHDGEYGQLLLDGKVVYAHRLAFLLFNGNIPGNREIRHTCHNRSCVNPEHLLIGTRKENLQDMVAAGRSNYGERSPMSKLTEEEAREVRKLALAGHPPKDIAEQFGIHARTVSDIKLGKRWRYLWEKASEKRGML